MWSGVLHGGPHLNAGVAVGEVSSVRAFSPCTPSGSWIGRRVLGLNAQDATSFSVPSERFIHPAFGAWCSRLCPYVPPAHPLCSPTRVPLSAFVKQQLRGGFLPSDYLLRECFATQLASARWREIACFAR